MVTEFDIDQYRRLHGVNRDTAIAELARRERVKEEQAARRRRDEEASFDAGSFLAGMAAESAIESVFSSFASPSLSDFSGGGGDFGGGGSSGDY